MKMHIVITILVHEDTQWKLYGVEKQSPSPHENGVPKFQFLEQAKSQCHWQSVA